MFNGDYGATYSCITSRHYSENYAPDSSCVIKLAYLLMLDVKKLRTEVMWDTMVVNGQNYSGSTRPVNLRQTVISCFSDGVGYPN